METLQRKLLLTWLVSPLKDRVLPSHRYFQHFKIVFAQVDNGFILLLEKESFIDQLKDIVDKAEDMLNEDMEGERTSALTCSSPQGQMSDGLVGEVSVCCVNQSQPLMCQGTT